MTHTEMVPKSPKLQTMRNGVISQQELGDM